MSNHSVAAIGLFDLKIDLIPDTKLVFFGFLFIVTRRWLLLLCYFKIDALRLSILIIINHRVLLIMVDKRNGSFVYGITHDSWRIVIIPQSYRQATGICEKNEKPVDVLFQLDLYLLSNQ